MGMIRECDIYPGKTKDVELFEITIRRKGRDGNEYTGPPIIQHDCWMCPAALERAVKFSYRATDTLKATK